MLYPILSETRVLIDLSGVWDFCLEEGLERPSYDDSNTALKNKKNIQVPSSYNDLFASKEIRNHVGWIWYKKEFKIPQTILNQRIVLRFGSVTHEAIVYLNGKKISEHKGGFTPFEVEINEYIENQNDLRIAVNNIVDISTLPMGELLMPNPDEQIYKITNNANFDFFNYAGIHRPVKIYTTPHTYVEDIETNPGFKDTTGLLEYKIMVHGSYDDILVALLDEVGQVVASSQKEKSTLSFNDVKLWEPLNSYLYNLKITLFKEKNIVDTYDLPVGIRTVEVKNNQFLINNKPFYFKGYGMHEDSDAHGRGMNPVMDVLNLNLLKWSGANSFRTSHYPYSEEMMRLADREGIVVIDETPAVGLSLNFSATTGSAQDKRETFNIIQTKKGHEQVIREMIHRDKNHACVVMWSIANEPASDEAGAYEYFKPLIDLAKSLDPQKRPNTIVLYMGALPHNDKVSDLCDVICINRYYGWYIFSDDLEMAKQAFKSELEAWKRRFSNKPIMLTEYGADTIAGMHDVHKEMYSEEYQIAYYQANHEVMDQFDFVVGEQVWNFADFETSQGIIRVQGNKKGVFTRDRKPKSVAMYLKSRWENIPNFEYKTEPK